ncbi:MAG: hypothetical protein LBS82_06485 [Spirochaetaceae bacterium]|jgi:hypothetical protein|nr:hypothetical protein [Spirochaetaceae bacterium]
MKTAAASLATLAACLCCAACIYNEPSTVSFTDGDGAAHTLFARSKKAAGGAVKLDANGTYEYRLEEPLSIPKNSSILVDYTLSGVATLAAGDETQCVLSIDDGERFVLPFNFSFIGINALSEHILYALPVNATEIGAISITTQGKNKTGGALTVATIQVTERTLGYRIDDGALYATPFVYADAAKGAIVIEPPPEYALAGKINLRMENIGAPAAIASAGRRYEYVAGNPAVENSITMPECAFAANPYPIVFEGDARSVLATPAPTREFPREPVPADPGIILSAPQSSWRDERYEVYRWDAFPSILIFDAADYEVQDRMLKRLAFFAEKKGYRGKIVSDEDMEGQHGWNAHDYRAETLAQFFNAANKINVPLQAEERELEQIVLANGIIARSEPNGPYAPGEGAIVSLSREIAPVELRQRLMVHECFHGIFFIDADFRAFSERRLANLAPQAKAFLRSYLEYSAYDTSDAYLFVNEFMAYVLQQPVAAAAEYFGKYWPEKFEKHEWRYKTLPKKDEESGVWPLLAEAFDGEAHAFSGYVNTRWGLSAGRLWRIKPR